MSDYYVIGKSSPRFDGEEKVTGSAIYTGDITPDRCLFGKIVGSPHAFARIRSIDTSEAEKIPGVAAIYTGKDVPENRTGGYLQDRHILCTEYVRYVGDYVALVLATDEETAVRAAAAVQVDYEELTPVLRMEEAFAKDCKVVVHPAMHDYLPTGFQGVEEFGWQDDRPNLFFSFVQDTGDTEAAMKEADVVVENTVRMPVVSHCTMETHQAVAIPEGNGEITLYATEQAGTTSKYDVAAAIGISPSKIHMHIPYLGGAFGAKTGTSVAPVAAFGALKSGYPVRIIQNREENFSSGGVRSSGVIRVRDGFRKDGTLLARDIHFLANGGAYSAHSLIMLQCASMGALGNYRTPNLHSESYGVYTNTPPAAPYRALGSEFFVFGIERNMDDAAAKLGIDRAEIRRRNLLVDGDTDPDGRPVVSNGSLACLEAAAKKIDLNKKRAPEGPWVFGKSVAVGNKFIGVEDPNGTGAKVKILDDGTAEIYVSHVELGQGGLTVDRMAAAEVLRMPPEKIRVVFGDSDRCPYDQGTFCSRGTFVNGNAVKEAAESVRTKVLVSAAERMGCSADELTFEDGVIARKDDPEKQMNVTELFDGCGAYADGGELSASVQYHHPNAFKPWDDPYPMMYSIGSWGIEVAVNTETGEVRLVDLEGAYDAGTIVNQKACEAQIEGAFSMGLGQSIYEEILFNDQGKVINPNFRDYKIPTMMDGPAKDALHFEFVKNYQENGPYGAKGIGEVSLIPVIPAVAGAVSDAVGVKLNELPLSRERVLRAIREKEER